MSRLVDFVTQLLKIFSIFVREPANIALSLKAFGANEADIKYNPTGRFDKDRNNSSIESKK